MVKSSATRFLTIGTEIDHDVAGKTRDLMPVEAIMPLRTPSLSPKANAIAELRITLLIGFEPA